MKKWMLYEILSWVFLGVFIIDVFLLDKPTTTTEILQRELDIAVDFIATIMFSTVASILHALEKEGK